MKFFKMAHLFLIRHNLAPAYLMPNFNLISSAHSYNTRGSNNNFCLTRDLSLFSNGFAYTAIKQWNSLPEDIKSIDQFKVFKRKLKQYLILQYEWSGGILSDGSFVMDSLFLQFYVFTLQSLLNLFLYGTSLEKSHLDFHDHVAP